MPLTIYSAICNRSVVEVFAIDQSSLLIVVIVIVLFPYFSLVNRYSMNFKTFPSFFVLPGSNHYGIAGWYSMMASKKGLVVSFLGWIS